MTTDDFTIPPLATKPFIWTDGLPIIGMLKDIPYDRTRIPPKGISSADAKSFAEWVTAGALNRLETLFPRRGSDWDEYSATKCGFAAAAVLDLTCDISQGYRHNFNMQKFSGRPHSAVVLRLPVQPAENERPEWKHFLIDPTFAQFFYINTIGDRLVEKPEGATFAKRLLKDGYVELTEETAKIYMDAFMPLNYLSPDTEARLKQCHGSYLELLCHPDFSQAAQGPLLGPGMATRKRPAHR